MAILFAVRMAILFAVGMCMLSEIGTCCRKYQKAHSIGNSRWAIGNSVVIRILHIKKSALETISRADFYLGLLNSEFITCLPLQPQAPEPSSLKGSRMPKAMR